MRNNALEEIINMLAAQSRLFINVETAMELYYGGGNNTVVSDVSYAQSDANITCNEMYAQQDRFYAWRERVEKQRILARGRLNDRLRHADQSMRPYNPNALGHLLRSTRPHTTTRPPFAPLAEAVRAAIKADRVGDRAGLRICKQRLIELAYNCTYTPLVYAVMGKHWNVLRIAASNAQYRFDTGHWKAPVWAGGGFIDRYPSHFVHASRETPGNVAFYADTDKLEADKLTSMKPGRYLSAFYGDDLTDEQIKQWANKQLALTAPVDLKFIGNDDPLGWVWVYENSTPSCMRYNRNNRYINSGLKDNFHPVTVYAHPENNLSLAYMMLPGKTEDRMVNCDKDEYVVGGRTIVNTRDKTYLRIYGAGDVQYTAMKEALERAGYTQSGSTLHKAKLRLVEAEDGYLCPYLDGSYVYVRVYSSHLLICVDGLKAHETGGYVRDEDEDEDDDDEYRRVCCGTCEETYDEQDGTYVDSEAAWVCTDCIAEHFVRAFSRHRVTELHRVDSDGIVYCEYNDTYYVTEYLSDNGMGVTEDDEVYPDEQLVETEDGVYHMDAAIELTYEFNDYVWARHDCVYHLPNGETCHVNDADKIAEIEALEQEAA